MNGSIVVSGAPPCPSSGKYSITGVDGEEHGTLRWQVEWLCCGWSLLVTIAGAGGLSKFDPLSFYYFGEEEGRISVRESSDPPTAPLASGYSRPSWATGAVLGLSPYLCVCRCRLLTVRARNIIA